MQHLSEQGDRLWKPLGNLVTGDITNGAGIDSAESATTDGVGGLFVLFRSPTCVMNYVVKRIQADGSEAWTGAGVVATGDACAPSSGGLSRGRGQLVTDGQHGVLVFWRELVGAASSPATLRVQHLSGAGAKSFGANGLYVSGTDGFELGYAISGEISDGQGGALVYGVNMASAEDRQGTVWVQRLNGDGTLPWGPNGVQASAPVGRDLYSSCFIAVGSDSEGGAFVAWTDTRPTADSLPDIYAQHVDATGALAWPSAGVPVTTGPGADQISQIASDGSGGALAVWEGTTDTSLPIAAQRLSSNGAPLWGTSGIRIDSDPDGYGYFPAIVSDARDGAIVVWDGVFPNFDGTGRYGVASYAQRIDASGLARWGDGGTRVLFTARATTFYDDLKAQISAVSDGEGGIFLGWSGYGASVPATIDLFAQHVNDLIAAPLPKAYLQVVTSGNGHGRVSSRDHAIDCGTACGMESDPGAEVTLTAIPDRGTLFRGWSGACAGSATTCRVTTNAAVSVGALFSKEPDRVGVFRPSSGFWYLDRSGDGKWGGCAVDRCFGPFGLPGDLPVSGNWTGELVSAIGIFRPQSWAWALDLNQNGLWDGGSKDLYLGPFGLTGDRPVVGDWGGKGYDAVGVFRNGYWYVDLDGNGAWGGCPPGWSLDANRFDWCRGPYGKAGDLPVVGKWLSQYKSQGIGVFRPSTGQWYLTTINGIGNPNQPCATGEICLGPFGLPGDLPVVGDWTGSDDVRIGVFRPSTGYWYLDINGNGRFDGCSIDSCQGPFGLRGDLPIVGRW